MSAIEVDVVISMWDRGCDTFMIAKYVGMTEGRSREPEVERVLNRHLDKRAAHRAIAALRGSGRIVGNNGEIPLP